MTQYLPGLQKTVFSFTCHKNWMCYVIKLYLLTTLCYELFSMLTHDAVAGGKEYALVGFGHSLLIGKRNSLIK